MLAELSRMMTAAVCALPHSEPNLVIVGRASPSATSSSTAARSAISSTSWIRLRRRVFSALRLRNRSVEKGNSFARRRLIMCSTIGIAAAKAAIRNSGAANVTLGSVWQGISRA